MIPNFDNYLDKYADVIIRIGLNLQPGQRLLIGAPMLGNYGTPLELAPLVRLVTEKAYQAGARLVDIMWADPQSQYIRYQHAPRDSFDQFPAWRADAAYDMTKSGDAILVLYAENPDLLAGTDPDLVSTVHQTSFKYTKAAAELRGKNANNWLIATAPVTGWPDKVFPHLPPEERLPAFWEALFDICRVKQPDPVAAWNDHIENLSTRREYLNQKQYVGLHLTGPGTDLSLGLPVRHIWRAARMTAQNGIDFTANIPTEEVFCMPHRDQTEGVVASSRPLSYGGSLIEEFSLTFSGGRVVKATAKKGEESLHKLLDTDEGARLLGEIALVPYSSPISQSGLLFYNILIDENAANHIALGRAYAFNLEGGETLSDDDLSARGANKSLIHIDFMIGSGEMDVDGITAAGSAEPVMRNGEWAFEL
jgi:aminopeptidase